MDVTKAMYCQMEHIKLEYYKKKRVYAYKMFIKFLKKERILNDYIIELNKSNSFDYRKESRLKIKPIEFIAHDLFFSLGSDLICKGFSWIKSEQGRHFWADKDYKWCKIHQKIIFELKEYETKLLKNYEACYNGVL
jgi:hypothetical protein